MKTMSIFEVTMRNHCHTIRDTQVGVTNLFSSCSQGKQGAKLQSEATAQFYENWIYLKSI